MRREDLISIICKLKHSESEYKTIHSELFFDVLDRKYRVKLSRKNEIISSFEIEDMGEVVNHEAVA